MRRFDQLDSLRGLAALTVVAHHFLYVFPAMYDKVATNYFGALKYTPLHIFWAGSEAVLFFFVLSGFVLSLPFYQGRVEYFPFVVKRIYRIYIPYCAAIASALVLRHWLYHGEIHGLSGWFNGVWKEPISSALIANHFLLIGSFDNGRLIPIIWSLVHEMRLSLVFPVIMACINRWHWKICLIAAYIMAFLGMKLHSRVQPIFGKEEDYTRTLLYLPLFVAGALLARHQNTVVGWFNGLSTSKKILLLVAAVMGYTFRWWAFPNAPRLHLEIVDNTFITLGVLAFLVASLASARICNVLLAKPFLAIGRASYSLYLFHAICLVSLIHLLYNRMPMGSILSVALLIIVPVSYLSYRFVELPAIYWGRTVSRRLVHSVNEKQYSEV